MAREEAGGVGGKPASPVSSLFLCVYSISVEQRSKPGWLGKECHLRDDEL